MSGFISDTLKEVSRNLRKNMTESERIIWFRIKAKKLGHKFLRQKPLYLFTENSGLGRYVIPDFVCLSLKLIVEIDGDIHETPEVYLLDLEKEKLLNKKGFKVIRIKNIDIKNNTNKEINKIAASFP